LYFCPFRPRRRRRRCRCCRRHRQEFRARPILASRLYWTSWPKGRHGRFGDGRAENYYRRQNRAQRGGFVRSHARLMASVCLLLGARLTPADLTDIPGTLPTLARRPQSLVAPQVIRAPIRKVNKDSVARVVKGQCCYARRFIDSTNACGCDLWVLSCSREPSAAQHEPTVP
jgi:hypothetical protein